MGKKKREIKRKYCEILLATYNHTQAEITRYRDREWAVPGVFIAAMITLIGFIITNQSNIKYFIKELTFLLFLLACGNTFYLLFTHKKLTNQRVLRRDIQYKLRIHKYKIEKRYIFKDYEIEPKNKDSYHSEWMNGFWDHILPFILSGWIVFFIGRWILLKSLFIPIIQILENFLFLFN